MSEVISSFESMRAGSQGFSLLILFPCVILHTTWSGKSLPLMCILLIGIFCVSAIRMMFVNIIANANSVTSVTCELDCDDICMCVVNEHFELLE